MYNELYEAWRREKQEENIQTLSKDFYARLTGYMRKMKEERRMLDEKTTKAKLLLRESKNAKRLVRELVQLRYEKTIKKAMAGEDIPRKGLTEEEEQLYGQIGPSIDSFQAVLKGILGGHKMHQERKRKPKKTVLRFVQNIPAIIGADMRTYGPFKPEDVASLPLENAKILIKQGAAVAVEAKY